jgi:hypothetical protein
VVGRVASLATAIGSSARTDLDFLHAAGA